MARGKSTEKVRGTRYNAGKDVMTLISPLFKRGIARVLHWALKNKYGPWNWAKGLDVAEVCDSLERHLDDLRTGKFYDKDSGLPVVDHIGCNAMFLSHFHHNGMWNDLDENMPYQFTLFEDIETDEVADK